MVPAEAGHKPMYGLLDIDSAKCNLKRTFSRVEKTMRWPKWGLAGLLALAGLSFWVLLAGPEEILGLDLGKFSIGLSALVAWAALHGVTSLTVSRRLRVDLTGLTAPELMDVATGLADDLVEHLLAPRLS